MKKKRTIVYVEGETEEVLFQDLNERYDLFIAIKKVNLWNNDIRKLAPNIPANSDIVIVFDTDDIRNIQRFIINLNFLCAKKHKVHLFQQTNNLESELAYICSCSESALLKAFCPKIVSIANFKNEFIRCSTRLERLTRLGFDIEKAWSRDLVILLDKHRHLKSSYTRYFGKRVN